LIPSLLWGSQRDENHGRMTGQLEAKRPTDRRLVTSRRLQHTTTHSLTPSCQKAKAAADWRQPNSVAEDTYTVNTRLVPEPPKTGLRRLLYRCSARPARVPYGPLYRQRTVIDHGQLMTTL